MNKLVLAIAAVALSASACAPQTVTEEASAEDILAEVTDANTGPVYTGSGRNIAISGYDAVSYFTGDGTPVPGNEEHAIVYNGVQYHFATRDNAETFQADPARYAPAYGGYCAWAAAGGDLAPGDPETYRIVDDRLYLNFNGAVQQRWEADIPGFITRADENYPRFASDAESGDSLEG